MWTKYLYVLQRARFILTESCYQYLLASDYLPRNIYDSCVHVISMLVYFTKGTVILVVVKAYKCLRWTSVSYNCVKCKLEVGAHMYLQLVVTCVWQTQLDLIFCNENLSWQCSPIPERVQPWLNCVIYVFSRRIVRGRTRNTRKIVDFELNRNCDLVLSWQLDRCFTLFNERCDLFYGSSTRLSRLSWSIWTETAFRNEVWQLTTYAVPIPSHAEGLSTWNFLQNACCRPCSSSSSSFGRSSTWWSTGAYLRSCGEGNNFPMGAMSN